MNERILKWKEWWATLAERERRILTAGSVIVVLALFYVVIWAPYLNRVEDLRQAVQKEQKTLRWMEAADKEIKKLQRDMTPRAEVLSPVELLSYLQKQLGESGLDVSQLKQASNDSVQMQFQKVDFDLLIGFLVKVAKEQSVTITQMSAIADASPGVVNADIVLSTQNHS